MKAFRISIAVLIAACSAPLAVLAAAWLISAVGNCKLQLEAAHVCTIASADVGWLLDDLMRIGVWGALTLGLGAYIFAAWVMLELAAIVLGAMRRS